MVADRHGPRRLTLIAGILAGGSYYLLASATEVWQLYVLYSLGAIGVGIVYTVAVNTALKWFPDRKGLTTGIGTMAFAGGAAFFVPFVRANATVNAYGDVLRVMGGIIGACILLAGSVLRDPPREWFEDEESEGKSAEQSAVTGPSYTWQEVLQTWQFWLMYAMFIAVSGAGLMLTAKIVSFAQQMEMTALTATASATLLPIAGGIGRLILGELSDRVHRRKAMAVSFTLCGIGLLAVVWFGQLGTSLGFLAAVVIATFFWSPQYTLFPSVVADYYGEAHSSANYALLYSGKMWGGVFGGTVAGWLVVATGWSIAFVVGGVLAMLAGMAALVLKPPKMADNADASSPEINNAAGGD